MSRLSHFFHILETVAPAILMAIPQTRPVASNILAAIADAEQLPGVLKRNVSGAEKKTHLMTLAEQAIIVHNQLNPSHPLDMGTTLTAVSGATEAILATIKLAEQHPYAGGPADGQAPTATGETPATATSASGHPVRADRADRE